MLSSSFVVIPLDDECELDDELTSFFSFFSRWMSVDGSVVLFPFCFVLFPVIRCAFPFLFAFFPVE